MSQTSPSAGPWAGTCGAQLPVLVKRVLRKYGYPADKHAKGTVMALEQAEVLSEQCATA